MLNTQISSLKSLRDSSIKLDISYTTTSGGVSKSMISKIGTHTFHPKITDIHASLRTRDIAVAIVDLPLVPVTHIVVPV